MPGPPPPPPLPGMGRGSGPPPPPGPPPPGGMKKPVKAAGRGALLGDIQSGARLKKVGVINDRSSPIIDNKPTSAAPVMGAPPIPGMNRPPPSALGLAPPSTPNRARSNSAGGDASTGSAPPQLAGIFAGGMPKLRKTGGTGVDTGADRGGSSPYMSDPESTRPRPNAPRAPTAPAPSAPRPPGAPPLPPGAAPPLPGSQAPPSVASLRGNLRAASYSMVDISTKSKPKPPPPGIKPKPPLPGGRKPSGLAPPPPNAAPTPPSAPPLPPSAPNGSTSLAAQAARNAYSQNRSTSGTSPVSAPPPPPPGSAPTPPALSGRIQNVQDDDEYDPYNYSNPTSTPLAAPSLPPPRPSNHAPPPPPGPPSRGSTQTQLAGLLNNALPQTPSPSAPPPPPSSAPQRPPPQDRNENKSLPSLLSADASSYTLTNGGSRPHSASVSSPPARSPGMQSGHGRIRVEDARWRFQDDSTLPMPREFRGGPKRYRAGRVSSVPLDLGAYD